MSQEVRNRHQWDLQYGLGGWSLQQKMRDEKTQGVNTFRGVDFVQRYLYGKKHCEGGGDHCHNRTGLEGPSQKVFNGGYVGDVTISPQSGISPYLNLKNK